MDNVLKRINKIAENEQLTITSLEAKLGASKGVLSRALSKNTDIQAKWLTKLVENYPQYSPLWILTGDGSMMMSKTKKEIVLVGKHAHSRLKNEALDEAFSEWQGIGMYNVPISASFVDSYKDTAEYQPTYYLRDPRFKDCDFGAIITGDSMHSEIRHGDYVVCKELADFSFLVFGEIYYVVASNGLETCKYINAGKDESHILLVPRNEKISSSPLKKDMIRNIYKVKGVLRGY
jgi:phage repressor protein C with HTH and peptisase S24 domain